MKRSVWHQSSCLTSSPQLEAVLSLGGHLTMSKDIFFFYVMTGEAATASKHLIIHRIASPLKQRIIQLASGKIGFDILPSSDSMTSKS